MANFGVRDTAYFRRCASSSKKTKTHTKTNTHNDSKSISKCSHQTKLSGMEGGETTWLHFLSTNRWTNAGTNVKLFLRGWYQATDQQVCRFWRSVGLLHGSNLPATQQQGGQTTHLRLCIRHCAEIVIAFGRLISSCQMGIWDLADIDLCSYRTLFF